MQHLCKGLTCEEGAQVVVSNQADTGLSLLAARRLAPGELILQVVIRTPAPPRPALHAPEAPKPPIPYSNSTGRGCPDPNPAPNRQQLPHIRPNSSVYHSAPFMS